MTRTEVRQPAGPQVIALDVGGTTIKGARFDDAGRCSAQLEVSTPVADGPTAVIDAIRGTGIALMGQARPAVVAAGVVVPGVIDQQNGVARYSANLGWREVQLRRLLSESWAIPVVIGHDVRAASLAEAEFGAARGVDDWVFVSLGTGIFAARLTQGQVDRGVNGRAGEIGHVTVHPSGELCTCGNRGCLEVYASAAGIARRYVQAGGSPGLTAAELAGRLGVDPVAAVVWREAVEALAVGLRAAVLLLDPALIVLGGGLAGAGQTLIAPLRAELAGGLAWLDLPPVAESALGSWAGRLGAAMLAWRTAGRGGLIPRLGQSIGTTDGSPGDALVLR